MSGLKKTRGDVFITIRSRDLISTSVSDFNNSGRFNLFENIVAREDEMLAVELVSATIPNSFYNLSNNNQNNTISFKETNDASYKILTIPSGSYDILELSTEIKTLLEANSTNGITYTFSYTKNTPNGPINAQRECNFWMLKPTLLRIEKERASSVIVTSSGRVSPSDLLHNALKDTLGEAWNDCEFLN